MLKVHPVLQIMGGKLDATNAIPAPEVAVITNIGLDHTDALGNTLPEIAANKAGIIKPGCHAVVYRGSEEVEQVYEDLCAELAVPLRKADFDSIRLHSCDLFGQIFDCGSRQALQLPLLGNHQLHNAAVVLAVIDTLIEKGYGIAPVEIFCQDRRAAQLLEGGQGAVYHAKHFVSADKAA